MYLFSKRTNKMYLFFIRLCRELKWFSTWKCPENQKGLRITGCLQQGRVNRARRMKEGAITISYPALAACNQGVTSCYTSLTTSCASLFPNSSPSPCAHEPFCFAPALLCFRLRLSQPVGENVATRFSLIAIPFSARLVSTARSSVIRTFLRGFLLRIMSHPREEIYVPNSDSL